MFRLKLLGCTSAIALGFTAPAYAYPIDCAIFLCLAGGWPSSPDCNAARAEFIRRITPLPVEPPLQLWRCPMGATSGSTDVTHAAPRRHQIIKCQSASRTSPERRHDASSRGCHLRDGLLDDVGCSQRHRLDIARHRKTPKGIDW